MVTSLIEFPEHRRVALLWQYARRLDSAGVDELVRNAVTVPCRPSWTWRVSIDSLAAELGDDSRYHLRVNGRPCSGGLPSSTESDAQEWQHQQWCYWWTDGEQFRTQPPPPHRTDLDGWTDNLHVDYVVRPTGTTLDPTRVPKRLRCPATYAWPPHRDHTALGRLRTTLMDTLGLTCHCCRGGFGMFVDHDHFTSLVRGLICHDCNSQADRCLHLDNCVYADYLNDPPAAYLGLTYPVKRPLRPTDQRTIDLLGFNPFTGPHNTELTITSQDFP